MPFKGRLRSYLFVLLYLLIMELFLEDEVSTTALFTAYIDHQFGFEIFCGEITMEWFAFLKNELHIKDDLQKAFRESVVLNLGVETFLEKACESFEMWCLLLEGTEKILNDLLMRDCLFSDDVYFVEGLYSLWRKGVLSEVNWIASVETLGKNSLLSGVAL